MSALAVSKKKLLTPRKVHRAIFIVSMLAWAIAQFLVFWVYINGRTIALTFMQYHKATVEDPRNFYYFDGLTNYIMAFKNFFFPLDNGGNIVLRNSFWNSLKAFPLNILVLLPLAILCSFAFYHKVRGVKAFRVLFFLPSIISIVVLTMLYRYMFNYDFGPIAILFRKVGIDIEWLDVSQPSKVIWPIIYIFCVWAGLGMNVLLLSSAMSRLPTEVLESARIDGVGFWRELFQIVIPMIWGTISTLLVLGTMSVFGFFVQPYLIGGSGPYNGQTTTISIYIYNTLQYYSISGGIFSTTIGVLLCFLGMPFIFLIKWGSERFFRDIEF